jgi:hypothetical protein
VKNPPLLVADPEIPPTVASHGMHDAAGHGAYCDKPVILEVGDPAMGGNPNSPAIVLKERIHVIIRQSTAPFAVNGNLSVVPSVQAIPSAKPDAAIPGRQHGHNGSVGQTLLYGNRWDGEVTKAVEAIYRGDPNIALAILEEPLDVIG